MKVSLLQLVQLSLVFVCFVSSQEDLPYEGFLRAFPHANITALLNLDEPLNVKAYTFNPPPISCPQLPPAAPTDDVTNLRPSNIKVIMAMGDSITAGMSVFDTWIISLKEYRGVSYSIGGDTGVYTIPNFLLSSCGVRAIGASVGAKRDSVTNGFNAATSGAKSKDMLSQAQWLLQQLKSSTIDFNNDWKLLTIWIGSNNLCDVCSDDAGNNGVNYETNLVAALQFLYTNVPRVFVNLVAPLDVSTLWNIEGAVCSTIHAIACSCAGSPFSSDRAKVSQVAKDFVVRSYNIAKSFRKKDFAVVVQPFLKDTIIADRRLLSEADCFHPSAKGQALAAVALWNNMLSPSATKKTFWSETDQLRCPVADDKLWVD